MTTNLDIYELEPERYELAAAPFYRFKLERRAFLKALGGGLLIVSLLPAQQRRRGAADTPQDIGSWLHISTTGKVTVFTGKAEVGQNARTSLTQAVSEELGAPIDAIELIMADTSRVPYDMGTFGSMTTPRMVPVIRGAASAARRLLPNEKWAAIDFSKLGDFKTVTVTDGSQPKPPLGQSIKKIDGRDFVTGKHKYPSDLKLPGMLYGKVLRPNQYGATIKTFEAPKLEDVTIVRDGNFAGVAAPTAAEAVRAMTAVKVEWQSTLKYTNTSTLFHDLKDSKPAAHPELDDAIAKSAHKNEQTYTVAYIAHVPLEPRAAVAHWDDKGKLNVWTGTQVPFGVRDELAEAFGLKTEDVRVQVPDTGSGYGGKHTGEAAVEAARIAKAAGKPVKLVWTREEEFTWAYFRPAGVIDVRSGIDSNGRLTAWDFHNYNSGASAIQTPYNVLLKRTEFHRTANPPLRQGSYRGLAATANHFAREVHMDELAALAKMDPLEFRIRNATDSRLEAVLEAAAEKFGWAAKGKTAAGIAGGFEKGGYIACCAEYSGNRVTRLVAAFECGAIVNPDHLKMQIEGAMVMGLGGALFESIDFADGRITNPRLSKYRVPRFRDIPPIDVVLVDRKDLPSAGAGETPIVGVAPAIANAIYAATGDRRRSLPL